MALLSALEQSVLRRFYLPVLVAMRRITARTSAKCEPNDALVFCAGYAGVQSTSTPRHPRVAARDRAERTTGGDPRQASLGHENTAIFRDALPLPTHDRAVRAKDSFPTIGLSWIPAAFPLAVRERRGDDDLAWRSRYAFRRHARLLRPRRPARSGRLDEGESERARKNPHLSRPSTSVSAIDNRANKKGPRNWSLHHRSHFRPYK
jgi:hypothetical protein